MRNPFPGYIAAVIAAVLLAGCAGQPVYEGHPEARTLTPREVVASPESAHTRYVEWGGTVLEVSNLADHTELQVLSYPLNSDGQPDLQASPHGRFLVDRSGFLDPATYSPGRQLTVYGPIEGIVRGRVGEAGYSYPQVRGERLQLWPRQDQRFTPSNVQFGIGIGIGL
jgi:outer membrane lipoprotein